MSIITRYLDSAACLLESYEFIVLLFNRVDRKDIKLGE